MNDATSPIEQVSAIHPAALSPAHNIYEALARAKLNFPAILKDREVVVRPRDQAKRPYSFRYAQLDTILTAITKPLAEQGLTLVQSIVRADAGEYVNTSLYFLDGAALANTVKMIVLDQGPQAYGSAQMYARRQGVTLLLCLAAEDDDDGNAAEGNTVSTTNEKEKTDTGAEDLIPYGKAKPSTMGADPELMADYASRIIQALDNRDPGGAVLLYRELNDPEKMHLWRRGGLTMKYKQIIRDGMEKQP